MIRRRTLLTVAAGALAGCAAPPPPVLQLDLRLSDIAPGVPHFFEWHGRPHALVRTSEAMLADLRAQTPHTWSLRPIPSEAPPYFVYSLVSPASGCVLRHAAAGAPRYAPEREWQGGFYDPCRFAEWDYAGRAIRQYPDQQASLRAPDLAVPRVELRERSTLRLAS